MKFTTYRCDDRVSFGAVTDDGIVDVPSLWDGAPTTLLTALQEGPAVMAVIAERVGSAVERVPVDDVTVLAPLPSPPKVIAIAGNYVKHIKESKLDKGLTADPHTDTTPRPFLMPSTCIADPGATVPWPCHSREIDYEAELAIVMGAEAKCVTAAEAVDRVAGYTIANDVSARSVTFAEGRADRPWDDFYDWLNGKWADAFCPIGPYVVTADEIDDVRNLGISLTVNGRTRQDSNTASMIFDVYELVSFLSHIMTLTPGDIIATGTPSGVGMATDDYLAAGDVVTARIDQLGDLTFTLGERPDTFYTPCGR
jgi:2-keto-4-pentenoate hydratase/2-oxohepta-3-ene-1,7-dioic acid hydratase in catechol pathway